MVDLTRNGPVARCCTSEIKILGAPFLLGKRGETGIPLLVIILIFILLFHLGILDIWEGVQHARWHGEGCPPLLCIRYYLSRFIKGVFAETQTSLYKADR